MSKGYIKIIFSLLISSVYMSNKALASEVDSNIEALQTLIQLYSTRFSFLNDYLKETPEQPSFDVCMDPKETKEAENFMNEAELLLQQHAANTDDYKLYHKHDEDSIEYSKKQGNTTIYKLNHKVKNPDKYNYIISMLWNSNTKYFGDKIVKEKVVRAYSPNLMMIQHRYKNDDISFHGYYYALAKKVQVSDDTTIIVYASSDINDYNLGDETKYKNTIVESANLFRPTINSEYDVISGKLTKMFVNLSGFIIQKKNDCVDITYLNSMNINTAIFEDLLIRIIHSSEILNILRSTAIISKK
ncbi:fam-a protein [Plasmodium yoelii yoelii]|uniref:Fam-a protein n=1 Tax=Plasmodium yoelii yoelii TaxID=73239 RepID=A0AAE9WKG3_PLAYO|nr:fam-a protein [Plasmodium yoelii yoelii]